MKADVIVLVPFSTSGAALQDAADALLAPYRMRDDDPTGDKFDYLAGTRGSFHDPLAEGLLPARLKHSLRGRICAVERLPAAFLPYALVTPDGMWHDSDAYAGPAAGMWDAHYRALVQNHAFCWAIQYVIHK